MFSCEGVGQPVMPDMHQGPALAGLQAYRHSIMPRPCSLSDMAEVAVLVVDGTNLVAEVG